MSLSREFHHLHVETWHKAIDSTAVGLCVYLCYYLARVEESTLKMETFLRGAVSANARSTQWNYARIFRTSSGRWNKWPYLFIGLLYTALQFISLAWDSPNVDKRSQASFFAESAVGLLFIEATLLMSARVIGRLARHVRWRNHKLYDRLENEGAPAPRSHSISRDTANTNSSPSHHRLPPLSLNNSINSTKNPLLVPAESKRALMHTSERLFSSKGNSLGVASARSYGASPQSILQHPDARIALDHAASFADLPALKTYRRVLVAAACAILFWFAFLAISRLADGDYSRPIEGLRPLVLQLLCYVYISCPNSPTRTCLPQRQETQRGDSGVRAGAGGTRRTPTSGIAIIGARNSARGRQHLPASLQSTNTPHGFVWKQFRRQIESKRRVASPLATHSGLGSPASSLAYSCEQARATPARHAAPLAVSRDRLLPPGPDSGSSNSASSSVNDTVAPYVAMSDPLA